jgi:hypothetical protein
LLEGPQNGQKSFPIFGIIGSIPRKVDINAPPAQLPAQITEGEKFVGAQQHVDCPGSVGNGFDDVQLIGKSSARAHFRQVLGFVDQHGDGAAETKSLLDRAMIF